MKRLNIELDDELHKELKIKAAEGGYTISEYIRSQIEMLVVHKPDVVTYNSKGIKGSDPLEVCKNGHLLNKFGKCMEKGCKYGK